METAIKQKDKETTALTVPSFITVEDSDLGNQYITAKELTTPVISLVQPLSKAKKKDSASYLEGAQDGDILLSNPRLKLDKPVEFVPIFAYPPTWSVWQTKMFGGGMLGKFETEKEAQKLVAARAPGSSEVAKTYLHVLALNVKGSWKLALLYCGTPSTHYFSSSLNSDIYERSDRKDKSGQRLPRFCHKYTLTTVDTAYKNNNFWTYRFEYKGFVTKEEYEFFKEAYTSFAAESAPIDPVRARDEEEF